MKRGLGILLGLAGVIAVSAMRVSASAFETLQDSEDYEKIAALADEIVSFTNGGPVYDPFSEGVTVDDIDFENALKEYIDTPLFTSELLSVSEVEIALAESDYIWIVPIKAYGHLYEACAVRSNGEDGHPVDEWHISGTRGYEKDNTPTYIEQLKNSLAANPDISWEDYQFRLVGGADPIRFPVWIAMNEKSVEYLIPGREDAAGCLTDSSKTENADDASAEQTAFPAYSYPAVMAAAADSTYIEMEDSLGGTSQVLDVAAQPGKYQHKMMSRMVTMIAGISAAAVVAGVMIRRKRKASVYAGGQKKMAKQV